MKIRAAQELINFLSERKQNRKRELISLSQDLSPPKGHPTAHTCKAAVVLAYAHWEGFVKEAAQAYVNLVAHKSKRLDALALSFQALVFRQELLAAQSATRRIQQHLSLTRRFTDDITSSCTIDHKKAIDTESNLTAEVLENICLSVGLDYKTYWFTVAPFIDELVKNRCSIAHGEIWTHEAKYAREAVNFVIKAIDQFSTDIENAATLEQYLRKTS
ncbi:MAG: MAE_28990/MAE_18760 family HEPN-like nuclease [Candidatus Electronema sp. V4]|uniref:MAE_28990/MAE_18760 family HEPN-like nuclease n=1 Tax=Candidatus Electronema sp. V4 TaxID=3454756 RepID=UPI0040555D05